MDSEEKELLKKLLSKVENLEKELEKRDSVIQKIQEHRGQPEEVSPKFPPLPKTKDRLAIAMIRGARRKVAAQRSYEQTQTKLKESNPKAEELRKNFHVGEIILFAAKKKIPLGNNDEESSSDEVIIIKE